MDLCDKPRVNEGLDIDISKPNDWPFFTNLVLGYRTHNNSGSLGKSDIERDLGFFARLVGILKPKKAIICLGKNTFNGALKALGLDPHEGDFNKMLNDEKNSEPFGGIKIFGMAHPGYFGCLNRVGGPRSKHNAEEGLLKEVEDWKKMAARL